MKFLSIFLLIRNSNKRSRKVRQRTDDDVSYKIPPKKQYPKNDSNYAEKHPRTKLAQRKSESMKIPASNDIPETKNPENAENSKNSNEEYVYKYSDDPPSYWIGPSLKKMMVNNASEIFQAGQRLFENPYCKDQKLVMPVNILLQKVII